MAAEARNARAAVTAYQARGPVDACRTRAARRTSVRRQATFRPVVQQTRLAVPQVRPTIPTRGGNMLQGDLQPQPIEQETAPMSPVRNPLFFSPPRPEEATVAATEPESAPESMHRSRAIYLRYGNAVFTIPITLPAGLHIRLSLIGYSYKWNISDVPTTVTTAHTSTEHVSWHGVPARCLKKVKQEDNIRNLDVKTGTTSGNVVRPAFRVCFLYNNSRDYLPINIPIDPCPCVASWLMNSKAGRLVSRVPVLDKIHGVEKLASVFTKKMKLLMTVGGYPEDSFQFSRMGCDIHVMSRFDDDVLNALVTTTNDWVFPGG